MGFSLASLTAYTEQNNFPLLTKAVFGAKTIGMMTPQPGIKSAHTLNFLDTDAKFQAGGSCSFNASGTTSFTQRTLTVGKIAVMEEICIPDLEAYYLQTQLPTGSHYSDMPFEQQWTELKASLIASQLETAVWQGDTGSANANLKRFDGLIKIIDAEGTVVASTGGQGTAISSSNVRTVIEGIYTNIPAAIIDKDDLRVFMGWDVFRILINKLTADNLYHYTADDAAKSGEMYYPGTTLRIVAVHGLDGLNTTGKTCIVAARTSNMFFGTDMMGEEDNFRLAEMTDLSNAIRFRVDFKAGVQIAFPAEIVKYANS